MAKHVQLNNIDHAKLKVRTERSAALGDAIMGAPIFPYEFRDVQAMYPIVFTKDPSSGGFRPLALFGLEDGENLFLSEHKWDAPYVPFSVRMKPFVIGFATDSSGGRRTEVHVDVEHPRLSETEGEALFLEHGGYAPYLQEVSKILGEVHEGEQSIPKLSALLDELELLDPFTLDITLDNGTTGRLAGYYIINEEKLYSLNADALHRLQTSGFLQPIYMAVAALSQFRALIDRRNSRLKAGSA